MLHCLADAPPLPKHPTSRHPHSVDYQIIKMLASIANTNDYNMTIVMYAMHCYHFFYK